MTSNRRVFHYIDAMPGAGKTEYFVNLAERHLQENRNHILIYAAPTRRLLHETFERIAHRKVSMRNVFVVTDNSSGPPEELASKGRWLPDAPAVAINYLLGLITREEYEARKYAGKYLKGCTRTLRAGDVVLTTHETFLRVQLLDKTDNKFALLKKSHVVFDEARNCVIDSSVFSLAAHDWKALALGMKCRTIKSDRGFVVSEVLNIDPTRQLMQYFGVPKVTRVPLPVRRLKRAFDKNVQNGRASMYLLHNQGMSFSDLTDERNHTLSVTITLRPISLFTHYGKVTLVSAFLKDSQMFHFLKQDGHTFVNLLEDIDSTDLLWPVKTRSKRLRENISTRLQVAPLLREDTEDASYLQTLSSHLLQHKLVVPIDFNKVSTSKDQNNLKYIPDAYRAPPLWILLRAAAKVFHSWRKTHTYAETALLTLNADSNNSKWRDKVRHLAVVRSILKLGFLYQDKTDPKVKGAQVRLSPDERLDVKFTSEAWLRFLTQVLYDYSDDRLFTTPTSPSLYGVNTYSSLFAFVHLAALNPPPNLIRLYNFLIPDYDVNLDHSIDNLVQMLYRTNLRDPRGTKPVLLITAYSSVAQMLAAKLKVSRFDQVHTPALKTFVHNTELKDSNRITGPQKGGVRSRKYKPEFAKQIKNTQVYISIAKAKLKAGPNPQQEARLAELKAKLSDLQAKGRVIKQ